jgi:hypothetical protein
MSTGKKKSEKLRKKKTEKLSTFNAPNSSGYQHVTDVDIAAHCDIETREGDPEEEQQKKAVVPCPNAVVEECAVVVHAINTPVRSVFCVSICTFVLVSC